MNNSKQGLKTQKQKQKQKFSKVAISLPTPLLQQIEHHRYDVPRSVYIKNALKDVVYCESNRMLVPSTRDEGIIKNNKFTEMKLTNSNRRWLENYVKEIDDCEEYELYLSCGFRYPTDGILFALANSHRSYTIPSEQDEQVTHFVDEEIAYLQKHLATDFFLGHAKNEAEAKQIEEYLDLFLKARGEFLFYTCPMFKGIKEKLSSLGLDAKAYEERCREVVGYDPERELDRNHKGYTSYRVDIRIF
jgi:hypothetical protein